MILKLKLTYITLDEFYSIAPVPAALQLYKNKQGEKKISKFLCDELSLFLDGGVSFAIFHQSQVIGIGINLLFERCVADMIDSKIVRWLIFVCHSACRTEDTAEYITAEAWHNTAAGIASGGTPGDLVHCWRHYQLLHLQHFCQNIAR